MITHLGRRLDQTIAQQAALIKQRKAKSRNRKFILKRPPKLVYPIGIEREYQRDLKRLVARMKAIVKKNLIDQLKIPLDGLQETIRPTKISDSIKHFDQPNYAEQIEQLLRRTRLQLGQELSEEEIRRLAEKYANLLSDQNKGQINKVFTSVLGVDVIASEPYLADVLFAHIRENVNLIKNIPEKTMGEIELMVFREGRAGTRHETIAKQINERLGVAQSRAELIARDQINKLNGALTETRQKSAGVSRYVWRTSLDERVRDEHADREGKTFSWDDPPSDGHPGEPINCRCWAEPILEDLVE